MYPRNKLLCTVIVCAAVLLFVGCSSVHFPEAPSESVRINELTVETPPIQETAAETAPEEEVSAASEAEEDLLPKVPWYAGHRLIYHACGGIKDLRYTNSREALELTLSKGNTLVEVDFLFTEDGHLVCVHRWLDMLPQWKYKELKKQYKGKEDQIPETAYTLDQFLNKKVKGKFTGLTAADIISYMKENPELYIIVDTKEDNLTAVIGVLLELCDYQPDLADRFVIQLYDRGQKEKILELYPFDNQNFLFTCYKFDPLRVDEILEICDTEQIGIVTVPYGSWEQETIDRFLQEQIVLFEHTVNDAEMVTLSIQKGIFGFYTDFLQKIE